MKAIIRSVLVILALLILGGIGYGGYIYFFMFGGPDSFETEPPALSVNLGTTPLLVFTKTNGYRDEGIRLSVDALQAIAAANGWTVFETKNGAVFNADQLTRFRAVIFSNVSGSVLLPEQRAAFEQYMNTGGGYVGIHGAGGDPSYEWRWYVEELLRAQFIGHPMSPQFQQAVIRIEDRNDPATRHLDETWVRSDEWYSFKISPRRRVHVLATLDERTYQPQMWSRDLRMGADHPIVWKHCVGSGRAFYSALGHTVESYAEPAMRQLLAGAIRWAAGLEGEGCTGVAEAIAAEPGASQSEAQ